MKRLLSYTFLVCVSLSTFARAGDFGGVDDFTDGVVATNLWSSPLTMGDAGLVETNGHLHFFANTGPAQKDSWYMSYLPWRNKAPVDYDWQVQMTVTMPDLPNTSVQQYQLGFALTVNDASQAPVNRFDFLICKDESNAKSIGAGFTTNAVQISDQPRARIADTALIRLRWVASTRDLYTEVSTNAGTTWSDLWGAWHNPLGMTSTDTFVCLVGGGAEGGKVISVTSNLFCDDFRAAASGPVVTSFGNGELTWTDQNTSSVFTIEWASHLTGPWSRTWTNLTGIHMTDTNKTVNVPMFYRVVCDGQ